MKFIRFITLLSITNVSFGSPKIILEHIENQILKESGREFTTVEEKLEANKIEVAKRKNLNILAKKNNINPDNVKSGKDLIEEVKKKNREKIKQLQKEKEKTQNTIKTSKNSINSWYESKLKLEDDFYKSNQERINQFLKRLKQAKAHYRNNRNDYLNGLTSIPLPKGQEADYIKVPTKADMSTLDKKIITGGLEVPIRDQGPRPTCSAFAAANAIEILAYQKGFNFDLSEQYLYWASKPECQKSPCKSRGSWVGKALEKSKQSAKPDIPLEENCKYINKDKINNDTQIPLEPGCFDGAVKVKDFKYTRDLKEVIEALNQDRPVIAGTKLNHNFFENNGLIRSQNSKKVLDLKSKLHSKGHAYTIIGYMKLPSSLHVEEGKFCFLINNSWSEGWGFAGRACATEEWLRENLNKSPFVILSGITRF